MVEELYKTFVFSIKGSNDVPKYEIQRKLKKRHKKFG